MKRKFTKEEVQDLVYENEIERIKGEDRRWSRTNNSIVEVENGKLYKIY